MELLAKFAMNGMSNKIGAASGKSAKAKSNGSTWPQLYPDDAKTFVKVGMLGFVALGGYHLLMTLAKRNTNPNIVFHDTVESMDCDPIIRDAFFSIQSYRTINPWLFKTALQNVDQLLFLENALLSQKVKPVHNDKVVSFTYFRMGVNRLDQLQYLIKERMGNEHAMAANIYVRKIYTQMQKHLLNILHLCSEFKPEHLIERAPMEIEKVLRNFEEGKCPEATMEKWERVRQRLDRKQRKSHHSNSSKKPEEVARHSKEPDSSKSRSVKSHYSSIQSKRKYSSEEKKYPEENERLKHITTMNMEHAIANDPKSPHAKELAALLAKHPDHGFDTPHSYTVKENMGQTGRSPLLKLRDELEHPTLSENATEFCN